MLLQVTHQNIKGIEKQDEGFHAAMLRRKSSTDKWLWFVTVGTPVNADAGSTMPTGPVSGESHYKQNVFLEAEKTCGLRFP
jgi:hypothetical protein